MNSGGSAPANVGGEPPEAQMGEPRGDEYKFARRPPKKRWLRPSSRNSTTRHRAGFESGERDLVSQFDVISQSINCRTIVLSVVLLLFNTEHNARTLAPRVLCPPATALLTYILRKAHTLLGVPPCSHITSRWYSSPDSAPAAILGQLTATHEIGLCA